MSILIPDMKMPKDKPIRIVLNPNGQLFVDHGVHFTEYKAVELPPHGRLIEEPKRVDYGGLAYISPDDVIGTAKYFLDQIRAMPTIIEAEGSVMEE